MKDPEEEDWGALHALLHIWLWRNEPEVAADKSRGRRFQLDDDLKAQLASYVN